VDERDTKDSTHSAGIRFDVPIGDSGGPGTSRRKDSANPIDKMRALLRSIGHRVCITIPR
jgi:hypothetical protein